MCIYIYIYIHTHIAKEQRAGESPRPFHDVGIGKGGARPRPARIINSICQRVRKKTWHLPDGANNKVI